jgi:GDPmannose 4,6-dehydratase
MTNVNVVKGFPREDEAMESDTKGMKGTILENDLSSIVPTAAREKSSRAGKTALITGITGQDGAYLAEYLLGKGYVVHGIKRRSSLFNTNRIDHLYESPQQEPRHLFLHHGDMTDTSSLLRVMEKVRPDEIYNLAAQSHVAVSFEEPEYTANSDALGPLRILEIMRSLGLAGATRFYQASSSEMYGMVHETPQSETTRFHPRSPYAAAKLYAYWITVNYREAYGIFACNGILFNHESPMRGETFVTRKICRALARISVGLQDCLYLGNLDARRDWGHARDYVEAQWLMLQQNLPADYVIASGEQHSVRQFVEAAAAEVELIIGWSGTGAAEEGYVSSLRLKENGPSAVGCGQVIVKIDPRYFRPTEVDSLLGDASKAQRELGWFPKTTFPQLVREMMRAELADLRKFVLVQDNGFPIHTYNE